MLVNEIIWGEVIHESKNTHFFEAQLYNFKGITYEVKIEHDLDSMWVFDKEEGPVFAEMNNAATYSEDGIKHRGFELVRDDDGFCYFNFTNPYKVNVSMLLAMSEVDPMGILTVGKLDADNESLD